MGQPGFNSFSVPFKGDGRFSERKNTYKPSANQALTRSFSDGFYGDQDTKNWFGSDEATSTEAQALAAARTEVDGSSSANEASSLVVKLGSFYEDTLVNDPNIEVNSSFGTAIADEGTGAESTGVTAAVLPTATDEATATETEIVKIEFLEFTQADSGAGVDAQSLFATPISADAGSAGTEAASLSAVRVAPAETGLGVEASSLNAARTAPTETGTGTEAQSVSVLHSDAEEGLGTESAQELLTPGGNDSAGSAEAETLEVWTTDAELNSSILEYEELGKSDAELALGAELESLSVAVVQTDSSGPGAEVHTLVAAANSAEFGSVTEFTGTIEFESASDGNETVETETVKIEFLEVFSTDSGNGIEEQSLSATRTDTEQAAGSESALELLTPGGNDQGASVEAEQLTVSHSGADTGIGTSEVEQIDILQTDSASATELESVTVVLNTQVDSGSGSELQQLSAVRSSTETGAGLDNTVLHSVAHTVTEAGTGLEAQTQSTAINSAENGAGTENSTSDRFAADTIYAYDGLEKLEVYLQGEDSMTLEETELILLYGAMSDDTDPYYSAVLSDRPRNYWRFGALDGNIVPDKMQRNEGIYNGVVDSVRGVIAGKNTAIFFEGTDSVLFGNMFLPNSVAIEFWIEDAAGTVLEKPGEFKVEMTEGTLNFQAFNTDGSVAFEHEVGVVIQNSHLVNDPVAEVNEDSPLGTVFISGERHFVWNVGEQLSQLYVNGIMHSEVLNEAAFRPRVEDGYGASSLSAAPNMLGVIDELAIYERLLTPTEVLKHWLYGNKFQNYSSALDSYNSFIHVSGYSKQDSNSEYEILVDQSTMKLGPQKLNSGAVNGRIEYAGDGTMLSYEYPKLTTSLWFSPDSTDESIVLRKGDLVIAYTASGRLELRVGAQTRTSSPVEMNIGQWAYFTAVFTDTAVDLYMNGLLLDTFAAVGPIDLGTGNLIMNETNNCSFAELSMTYRVMQPSEIRGLFEISYYGRADISATEQLPPGLTEGETDIYVFDKHLAGAFSQ